MLDLLRRLASGGGTPDDLGVLEDVAANIGGRKTLCMLGNFAAAPIWSALRRFRPALERSLARRPAAPPVSVAA